MEIDGILEIDIENKYINDKEKTKFTIEEAIYILKRKDFCDEVENIAIQTLLSELEKKDKIISLMAEDLMHIGSIPYRVNIFTNEQLIEQYANKIEEDIKE